MLAVATAVYGRVADLAGIRLPLLVGVVLMAGSAVLGAFAPSYEVLLAARVLQGSGAAAVPVLGMAIVSARYDGSVRTNALGRVAGTAAAVSALGPLAGGLVEDLLSWRAVVALPALGLLVVPALWRALPSEGTGARLDLLGAVLVAGTASGLVLLVQSPSSGVVVAVVGALLLALGVPAATARVRRRPEGFLPMAVVREPVVVRSALAASCVPAAWFALLIAVPAVLAVRGWTPLEVGLALVPSAVTGFLAPRLAGPLLVRLGPTRSLVTSGGTAALALVLAAAGASLGSAVLLVSAVVLVTFAFGLGQPALMAAVGGAVPADVRGVALGIATLVFLVGGGIGSAVVGGIGELVGIDLSLLLLALLPVLGALALVPTLRAERARA
jgi:MFS family permease